VILSGEIFHRHTKINKSHHFPITPKREFTANLLITSKRNTDCLTVEIPFAFIGVELYNESQLVHLLDKQDPNPRCLE